MSNSLPSVKQIITAVMFADKLADFFSKVAIPSGLLAPNEESILAATEAIAESPFEESEFDEMETNTPDQNVNVLLRAAFRIFFDSTAEAANNFLKACIMTAELSQIDAVAKEMVKHTPEEVAKVIIAAMRSSK